MQGEQPKYYMDIFQVQFLSLRCCKIASTNSLFSCNIQTKIFNWTLKIIFAKYNSEIFVIVHYLTAVFNTSTSAGH